MNATTICIRSRPATIAAPRLTSGSVSYAFSAGSHQATLARAPSASTRQLRAGTRKSWRWQTNLSNKRGINRRGSRAEAESAWRAVTLVKAVAFVSVIVIVEIVAASMLAPTAQETERLAQQFVAAAEGKTADARRHASTTDSAHGERIDDVREVELGIYNITRFNPTTNTTLAIDFELFGTVLADDIDRVRAPLREQPGPHPRASDHDAALRRVEPT